MHLNCRLPIVETQTTKLSTCLHSIYAELHCRVNLVEAEHHFHWV